MKLILTLFFLAVLPAMSAQEPGETPELPEWPLPRRAPDLAEWKMAFRSTAPEGSSQTSPGAEDPSALIVVTKNGTTYREIETDILGETWEKWHIDGNQVTFTPAGQPIIVLRGEKAEAFFRTDYSKSDFPEMAWISPENYTEMRSIDGKSCFVFEDEILPQFADEKVRAVAAIDEETLLPVLLDVGGEIRTYGHSASTEEIAPPPTVLEAVKERQKLYEGAIRIPSH